LQLFSNLLAVDWRECQEGIGFLKPNYEPDSIRSVENSRVSWQSLFSFFISMQSSAQFEKPGNLRKKLPEAPEGRSPPKTRSQIIADSNDFGLVYFHV
jgi:hypothetical protein